MAKKRNDQRRVQPTLSASDAEPKGMDQAASTEAGLKKQIEYYGKMRAQVVDISSQMESIFNTQQQITQESDRQYGIEKKVLNSLGVYANQVKMLSLEKKLLTKHSLEDSNIIKKTISDYRDYNQAAAGVAQKAKELGDYRRKQIPFEDKIRSIQQEITNLQADQGKGLTKANQENLKNLKTSKDQWLMLSKQEQVNKRIEKIQGGISDLMDGQNSAAGKIFTTLKDLVTNPLTVMVGLLAVGLQRYETMRQRGNELAEEHDRINKKLAGAGPFQDKIIQKATLIRDRFYEMGEGFSSSLEGSVDAIVALSDQFGKIDYVTGNLVKTMAELKLSIGLSDEASAQVLDNFMTVNGLSSEAAISMTEMTYQMSEQAGLNPQQVFQDIAAASGDTLATFSGSADELAKSAVTARRLGITLDDMASVSRGLLDFETSIEKEMEAQLITGIDLNLQKARSLAMQGKEAEAMEEVMKQVGGLERFNNMQPLKQKALADAVGLTVGQLQKTSKQREQEAIHATKKHDLVEKQYALAEKALPMLGKLDVGLGVMERIAVVIGDLFLDVFGGGLKDLEKTFFRFLESPAFKTGFKNTLFVIKGIIVGIKDAVMGTAAFIDKLSGGAIGGFLKSFASKDFSGSYGKAEGVGSSIGKGIAVLLAGKMLLGSSTLTPMYVKVTGGLMGGIKGLFNMFTRGGGGGLGSMFGGSPGQFYKGGQFMPGGGRAPIGGMMSGGAGAAGSKFMGMNLGSALGGTAGTTATGLGGTGLGMAGAALGAAGVIGSIGMGIYDVSQLDGRSTRRDKATARGGLGGALGGAATGALIGSAVPVIGTLLGAGIGGILGYFGGRSIGSMDAFRDELDTARDRAQEASEDKSNAIEAYQHRVQLDAMRGSLQVGNAFRNLSGGMKELSGKKMKEFGKLLIEQGKIGKDAFRQFAKDGKITMSELQKIQASVSDNILNMGNKQLTTIIDKVDENLEYQMIPLLEKQIQMLDNLGSGESDMATRAISQLSLTEQQVFTSGQGHVTEFETTRSAITKEELEKIIIAQAQITDLTMSELTTIFQAYNEAAETEEGEFGTSEKLQSGLVAAMNALAMKRETTLQKLSGERDGVITTEFNKVTTAVDKNNPVDISTNSINSLNKDKDKENTVTYKLDPILMQQLLEQSNPTDYQGPYARGGITYGPSHANGGIPTRYGELEGGEAVINKRSTAMFRNELSNLNVAGGGTAFADGGVTGKFDRGGTLDPYGNLLENVPTKPNGEFFPLSTSNTKGGNFINYLQDTRKDNWINKLVDTGKHGFDNDLGGTRALLNPYSGMSKDDKKMRDLGPQISKMHSSGMTQEEIKAFIDERSNFGMGKIGDEGTNDGMHLALDLLGLIPVVGNFFDLINMAAYMAEGKYAHAALSAAAAIPGAGYAAAATKLGIQGTKTAAVISGGFHAVEYLNMGNEARKLVFENPDDPGHGFAIDGDPGFTVPRGGKISPLAKMNMGLGNRMLSPESMMARGGVTSNSPIKKVNDMILTKDGQMIETHADDNLIAKKGAITQNKGGGGGGGRMEQLLEGILMAIQAGGDTYIDGAKVSAAINSTNYRV